MAQFQVDGKIILISDEDADIESLIWRFANSRGQLYFMDDFRRKIYIGKFLGERMGLIGRITRKDYSNIYDWRRDNLIGELP